MQNDNFTEKLYTSTEVAEILGVSLRSIYRYLDENKIQAAVKTATGRHRFTKQNINDFLHPTYSTADVTQDQRKTLNQDHSFVDTKINTEVTNEQDKKYETVYKDTQNRVEEEPVKEEPVDWLARFRQAAEKYKTQEEVPSTQVQVEEPEEREEQSSLAYEKPFTHVKEKEIEELETEYKYYRSGVGGLKEIAQALDKAAKNASLDYAYTMYAGLSLHKPIKPFSLIHAYVRPGDLSYFEKVLQLMTSQKDTAQLCLITSDDRKLYEQGKEMHGLFVVSDNQIKLDLLNEGETDLANELD